MVNFQYFLATKPLTKNQVYISQKCAKLTLQQCRISKNPGSRERHLRTPLQRQGRGL